MARVNVMTAITDNANHFKKQRIGMWLIEVIEGTPTTYQGILTRDCIGGQELTLQLLANALTKVKSLDIQIDSIAMYMDCQLVESALLNQWLDKWFKNDWLRSRDRELADRDTWIIVWNLLTALGDRYIVMREPSSFENWMHTQLKSELKKIDDKKAAEEAVERVKEILK